MQNIDVRFNASSNFAKVRADLSGLQAQVAALNSSFAKGAYATPPAVIDPAKWRNGTSAITAASNAYRTAASSSGLLNTQQMVTTSQAEKYTRALQKQKLTMGQMLKNRGIMKQVYNDQLRQQRMTAQYWGQDKLGRHITDITMPKNVPTELDNWRRRAGFFGNAMASAGTQVINTGKNIQWAGRQLMVGFTYPMVLFGAAAGAMAFKVEAAFAKINKVYDVTAAAQNDSKIKEKELGDLRVKSLSAADEAAKRYGTTVEKFLGTEAELAATGLNGDDLVSSTSEVSRISALGDIDPEKTTAMVVALKTSFRDTIPDAKALTENLNFMNAASNVTSLSLDDVATATPRAASGLAKLGVTAKEMTILLVSMREAGIDATSGGNALKSLSTRIMNPAILARAQKAYERFGVANINLQEIIDNNQGNIYGFVKDLGKAQQGTRKLTNYQKQQVAAILAGANQYSRFSAILGNVGDAQNGVNNQTAKTIDLQGQSAQQLANMAKESEKQAIQNPAGRLRVAWAELQATLADMGGPFLKAAAQILGAFEGILTFFQNLPKVVKNGLGFLIVGAALAGPLIMMVGLFLNLSGWLAKAAGGFLKLVGISKIYTKEETSAALTTEAVNKSMMKQQASASTLAAEIKVLTASYEQAAIAARNYLQATTGSAVGSGGLFGSRTAPVAPVRPQTWTPASPQQQMLGMPGGLASTSFNANNTGGLTTAQYTANANQAERLAAATRETRNLQLQNTRAAVQTNTAYLQGRNAVQGINGGLVASTAAAGGLAAMMLGGNGAIGQFGKMLLIASFLGPALILASKGAAKIGTGIMKSVAASTLLVREQAAAGAIMTKNATTGALIGARLKGAAVGAAALAFSSAGVGLALTGGILALMHYKQKQDEIAAKQKEMHDAQLESIKALNSSTRSIATNLGKAAGYYKQITNPVGGGQAPDQGNLQKSYDYYKNDEAGQAEIKGAQTETGGMVDTDKLLDIARTKFIDLQVLGSNTAEQARTDLQAMLIALGKSGIDAANIAQNVYSEYGNLKEIDWAGPIGDQVNSLRDITRTANFSSWIFGEKPEEVEGDDVDALKIKALKASQIFNQALTSAVDPTQAGVIIQQYMDGALGAWDDGYNRLVEEMGRNDGSARTDLKELFADYDVTDGKSFANAYEQIDEFKKKFDDLADSDDAAKQGYLNNYMKRSVTGSMKAESTIISELAKNSAVLDDNITTAAQAIDGFNKAGIGVESPVAEQILKDTQAYKDYLTLVSQMNTTRLGMGSTFVTEDDLKKQKAFAAASKEVLRSVNTLNKSYGYMPGKDVDTAIYNLEHQIPAAAETAEEAIEKVDWALLHLKSKNIQINIQTKQLAGIYQGAYDNVVDKIIDDENYIFDETQRVIEQDAQDAQDAASRSLQDRQEAASRALQDRQEAASRALQERQEAAQKAFDAKWEKRKDALTKAYDKRNLLIDNTIKREQKADEIRQKLFEKEKKRLEDLANKANTQIDFDVAVNTGDLDEAAKIQNSAQAAGMADEMDKEQARAEEQTQALIDRLEKKRDRLEKAKDKALKRLEKVEEKMRDSLEKMQEAQQRALQKQQEAQSRALQKSQEEKSRALQADQDAEDRAAQRSRDLAKREHDYKMELLKNLPIANKAQLEKALKISGIDLKKFGTEILGGDKGIAADWGGYFQKYLDEGLRSGAASAAKSNMWATVTDEIAKKMLKGFGFKDMNAFETFVRTGKKGLPSVPDPNPFHGGGEIGSNDRGGRGGLSGGGLHRTEEMIRAQKGEFVINRKAYAQNRELVRGINSGRMDSGSYRAHNAPQDTTKPREGLGGFPVEGHSSVSPGVAPLGIGYGAGYRGMTGGVGKGIQAGIQVARARFAAKERARRARQARADAAGNPGGNLPIGNTGPITDLGKSALSWAAAHPYINPTTGKDWAGACLSFVRQALGAAGGVYDAKASWAGARGKRGINDYNKVPAGVPVYWTTGANGHVILSAGNGQAYGTDNLVNGQALPTTIGAVSSWLGRGPDGWAHSINGKDVYPMRTGGEIRYDDTLINAHKGETVLPARLTQQFKENVKNGNNGSGGDHFTLDFRGAMIKEEVDIQRAVETAVNNRDRRQGIKRVVK